MTPEQFDSWWELEGMGDWTLCDRGTRVTISSLKDAPTRWALRSKTHTVYLSVGKVKRSKYAAEAGRDVATQWGKADIAQIPWHVVEQLITLARSK